MPLRLTLEQEQDQIQKLVAERRDERARVLYEVVEEINRRMAKELSFSDRTNALHALRAEIERWIKATTAPRI